MPSTSAMAEPLLPNSSANHKQLARSTSHPHDELRSFRSCLRWMCVDQSSIPRAILSWSVFLLFTIAVPFLSHFFLSCSDCSGPNHRRPYDAVIQLSLSSVATLSFLCLSRFVLKYGLRRFLFFDKLCHESHTVATGYTKQLNRSLKILAVFVLPCFVAESAYKIWWYTTGGGSRIPYLGINVYAIVSACILELLSWLYRTSVFFLVCILFRLICYLQILRLQDFAKVFFQVDSDVGSILSEHLRIRRHLRIISHRYRAFILWALLLITGSQFASLLVTMKSGAINVFRAGELALVSVTLLAGLFILLRSATKITHKAQAVTCLATKWHVCATVDSFEDVTNDDAEAPLQGSDHSDNDDEGDDDVDDTKLIPADVRSALSFQKRQALVTYLENNKAGITSYGFMLDRTYIHTVFGIELSLVLWLLGKTVGIS